MLIPFDKALFYKELVKTLKWLRPDERMLLYAWCIANFSHLYKEQIMDAFKLVVKS